MHAAPKFEVWTSAEFVALIGPHDLLMRCARLQLVNNESGCGFWRAPLLSQVYSFSFVESGNPSVQVDHLQKQLDMPRTTNQSTKTKQDAQPQDNNTKTRSTRRSRKDPKNQVSECTDIKLYNRFGKLKTFKLNKLEYSFKSCGQIGQFIAVVSKLGKPFNIGQVKKIKADGTGCVQFYKQKEGSQNLFILNKMDIQNDIKEGFIFAWDIGNTEVMESGHLYKKIHSLDKIQKAYENYRKGKTTFKP